MGSALRARVHAGLLAAPLALTACNGVDDAPSPTATGVAMVFVNFERATPGAPPPNFTSARTGPGAPAEWIVEPEPAGGRALVQRSTDPTSPRFPLCLLDGFTASDFTLGVRFLAVSGEVDRAAGLVARVQGPDDYLVVRANALEDNVRLYTVVAGERRQLASADVEVSAGEWHTLRLDAEGPRYAVFLDGKLLFTAEDATFTAAGRIGLWTKADSVTLFDDLRCEALLADSPLRADAER